MVVPTTYCEILFEASLGSVLAIVSIPSLAEDTISRHIELESPRDLDAMEHPLFGSCRSYNRGRLFVYARVSLSEKTSYFFRSSPDTAFVCHRLFPCPLPDEAQRATRMHRPTARTGSLASRYSLSSRPERGTGTRSTDWFLCRKRTASQLVVDRRGPCMVSQHPAVVGLASFMPSKTARTRHTYLRRMAVREWDALEADVTADDDVAAERRPSPCPG